MSEFEPATPEAAHRVVGVDQSGTLVVPVETPSLAEFLLARYAEEVTWVAGRAYRLGKTFVLADIEAKRRIVLMFTAGTHEGFVLAGPGDAVGRLLALPYADHPDYREEWKP